MNLYLTRKEAINREIHDQLAVGLEDLLVDGERSMTTTTSTLLPIRSLRQSFTRMGWSYTAWPRTSTRACSGTLLNSTPGLLRTDHQSILTTPAYR